MTWIFQIKDEIESCSECRLFESCEEIDPGRDVWLEEVNSACPYVKKKEES